MNGFAQRARNATYLASLLVFATMLNLWFYMPAWAATTAVVGDGSAASCTEAALATAVAAGGQVTFDCGSAPVTILFTAAQTLNTDVTLNGGGQITLSGGNSTRLFNVPAGKTAILRSLTIIDAPVSAAAIFNAGTLTVLDVTMHNNLRGAIYNAGGTVNVIGSTFTENSGSAITNENKGTLSVVSSTFISNTTNGSSSGGAVYGSTGSTNSIINSTFTGNRAESGSGGAIYNSHVMTIEYTVVRDSIAAGGGGIYNGGSLTIRHSQITNNQATSTGGGGIAHFNQSTTPSSLTIEQSTIDRNVAKQQGGGIWFSGEQATLDLVNATVYSNTAQVIGGGGLFVASGDATLTNVTFDKNVSLVTDGGSVENSSTLPGAVTLQNTLLHGGGCAGAITDGGGNLQFPGNTCGNTIVVEDPELAQLDDNGGWTPTLAFIDENGPARNAGENAHCPATDQRGVLRPQFDTCDVGAFEWGARPLLASISPTTVDAGSPTFTLIVTGSNFIAGNLGSRILWDGAPLTTQVISGTELRATINASLVAEGGDFPITVETPVVDGDVSQHSALLQVSEGDALLIPLLFGE